ncbi:glycoside hydrolase family 31 protein, partial [Exidia glandulosa HHB12029]
MGAIPVNRDVSKCPGYNLGDVSNSKNGLTAKLTLAGDECTAFGLDIKDLTVEVTYDTMTRLHVKIYDTVKNQFQIPESLIERSAPDPDSTADTSDLVFNYNAKPFEFWITRKGASDDEKPLFDTRKSFLPSTPVPPVHADDPSTALPAFNLIFEDQYIEITSALPKDTNLYGLGEYYSSSGFRRDTGASGGAGSVQALVANGWSVELDRNSYSVMPFYTEHRLDSAGKGKSHGVLALNSNQGDVLLLTPQDADQSIIQYRFLGGVLDFYVFSGPSPMDVVEQYGQLLGFPAWTPTWAFGFHLCRWGYKNVDDWRSRVDKMREANIPLEVQWVDIDFYDGHRVFTSDPQNFPMDSVKQFISDLASNNQRMIPIVDPGIAIMDGYAPHDSGLDRNVFIKMNNGSVTRGRVWPGDTYFPDWFAENTQDWWTQNLKDWHDSGVSFSGIWLDMNEASNFCDGICDVAYDPSTTKREIQSGAGSSVAKRAVDGDMTGRTKSGSVNFPPYQIHQNGGSLVKGNIDAFSMHGNGALEYDVHNMYGLGEEKATFNALVEINNGERPFLISRSAFPSSGRWTGHWLGDNHGDWWAMWASIQGMLQFTMNQIPMVGADTCGHMGVTTEDLCSRWMMMSAFTPFYRNHHTDDGNMQEPYLWESVADASRIALTARYSLLPYWATLFADASLKGTPPMRALYWEFPDDASLFGVDQQFMVGPSILVTPVLEPDVQSVNGVLPGNEETEAWYDFWTHDVVTGKGNITMEAKMNQINVHIRGGSALLLHSKPAYTTVETRASPYTLLVALGAGSNATATGSVYLDDGLAYPPGPSTRLSISSQSSSVDITPEGEFTIEQKLAQIEVLGVPAASFVTVNGEKLPEDKWTFDQEKHKLIINHDGIDLNQRVQVAW